MPLGNVLGEFTAKAMSVRISELGGGQRRVEADFSGEATGQVPGQVLFTMTTEGTPGQPVTYSYTGVALAAAGAVVRFSGRGVGIRTGEGHKARYRGAVCFATDDPKLVAFNSLLAAVEFEIDPTTLTVKGAYCEWK